MAGHHFYRSGRQFCPSKPFHQWIYTLFSPIWIASGYQLVQFITILWPRSDPISWGTGQSRATCVRRNVPFRLRAPPIENLSMTPMKLSCPRAQESLCVCTAALAIHPPPSNDRLLSSDSIPWVHRASFSLGALCSVRRVESSASDSPSVTVANAGNAARLNLA
jgi:hypothetical protein